MKPIFCILFSLCFCTNMLHAENMIVMSDDERVLVEKDAYEQRSIASTTKIMTAILCLESGDYIDVWKTGNEVASASEKRIYLMEGQEVSMRSLLYGLLLESGNDAAIVLAKRVGGTVEQFVRMMNEKAKDIGMLNTVFHNPHGLDTEDKGNLSTCYDMALLMKYALQNEQFCEIIGTKSYISEWGSIFHNSNRLLESFPFMIGGKTGYTSKAGRTLVTAAKNNELTLICVTFNLQDHFNAHQNAYVTLFNQYQRMTLLKKGSYRYQDRLIEVSEDFYVTCSQSELSDTQIRHWMDEETGEFIIQFQLKDYCVIKSYPSFKEKKFCFMGWCL